MTMTGAKTALVTGASSGIGYELAKHFAKDHHGLVVVARNRVALEKLRREVEREFKVPVTVLQKDLADPKSPSEIFDELERERVRVDYLVNNAGFGLQGLFWELDAKSEVDMVEVNVAALTHLTRLFLPGMVQRGVGGVLNVASTAAFVPGPLMSVYHASKAYVLSFTEALHNELKGTGVIATALCPGVTRTGFQKRAGIENSGLVSVHGSMEADEVARIGYEGFMRGKGVVFTGLTNRVQTSIARTAPRGAVIRMIRRRNERRVVPA